MAVTRVAVSLKAKRLQDLAEKYGVDTFSGSMRAFLEYGEKSSMAELAKLPRGSFELTEEQDDGQMFNVKIEISEKSFVIDLRDNPDQVASPINTSRDGVIVAAQMIFKSITDPYSPTNEGSFRPIELLTREGSIFHAVEPAPVGFYYEIELRVYDLIWRCLAPHMPDRLSSGHFGSVCGTFIGGTHPDTGRQYTIVEPQLGGWGASKESDGNSAIFCGFHGETYNCPAEINEGNIVLESASPRRGINGGSGRTRTFDLPIMRPD